MSDLGKKDAASPTQIVGRDELHVADVELIGGKRRLLTTASVTNLNVPFGQDPFPDSFFKIINTGAINDTWRVEISATANDPALPDRDVPAVDVTTVVSASEVGDELALRDKIISDLNADTNFKASLKAQPVSRRAIVHITSIFPSLPGEFYERPTAGDVSTTVTGTAVVSLASDKLLSRAKPSSLSRDPTNPHDLGVLAISGSMTVTPGPLPDQFLLKTLDGGSPNLRIDGSVTPVEFLLNAESGPGAKDLFISSCEFACAANGIKSGQFLSIATLANGIDIEIVSAGINVNDLFPNPIKETDELQFEFARGLRAGYLLSFQPGRDTLAATAIFPNPFVLMANSSDKILVRVSDDLTATSLKKLEFLVFGFKKEP